MSDFVIKNFYPNCLPKIYYKFVRFSNSLENIKTLLTLNYVLDILFLLTERLPSSRGLGHIPFTDAAGVQIPLGVPF